MPVLEIEVVTDAGHPLAPGLAHRLADAAAAVLGTGPGSAWVRLRELPASSYAENGGGPPAGVMPVFVRVLRADLPPPPELAQEMEELAEAVSRVCQRPVGNVHVLYEEGGRGRVGFGGRLLR